MHKWKRNDLPNPQNVPVYWAGQTHNPLSHGLLQIHLINRFPKISVKKIYPFIHNPPQGLSIDVSHRVPV
jgi:hypothetical protein